MFEKLKGYLKLNKKKILMGALWYAISLFCLWIWNVREGGWTKDQWIDYFVLLNVAWLVYVLFHKKLAAKQEAWIQKVVENAEAARKEKEGELPDVQDSSEEAKAEK